MSLSVLTISGSLRNGSSTHTVLGTCEAFLLKAAAVKRFEGIAQLPLFDDRPEIPDEVQALRDAIDAADAVLFCTPEYAFGIPGALKNALDWTVGSIVWTDKPVAIITAATGGEHAHRALLLTLTALGTARSDERNLLIPFIRMKMKSGVLIDTDTLHQLEEIAARLITAAGPKI